MSDFGTLIIVTRRDAKDVGDEDRAAVERAIAPLRSSGEHTDYMAHAFAFRIGDAMASGGAQGLSVLLSEYWHGDGEGFDSDELLESDEKSAAAAVEA